MWIDPRTSGAEEVVAHGVLWLKLIVEVAGAGMIGVGLVVFAVSWIGGRRASGRDVLGVARLRFAAFWRWRSNCSLARTSSPPRWRRVGIRSASWARSP